MCRRDTSKHDSPCKRSLVAVEMRHVRHSLGTLVSVYVSGGPGDHELSRPGPFVPELVFAPDSRTGVPSSPTHSTGYLRGSAREYGVGDGASGPDRNPVFIVGGRS